MAMDAVISWFDWFESHGVTAVKGDLPIAQRFEALQVEKERSDVAKCQDSALGRST